MAQFARSAKGEGGEQKQRCQSDDDDGKQEHAAYLAVAAISILGNATGTVDFEDSQRDVKAVAHAVD